MNLTNIDHDINILSDFLSQRDLTTLSTEDLIEKFHIRQVDVMVLFGGSILAGGDVLAEAINNHIAKHFVIVGGAGHTTETLRRTVRHIYPVIATENLSEAEIFQSYIRHRYHLDVDWLETNSTNCGNNITNLLALLAKKLPDWQSIILSQDATMQRRIAAGLRKYVQNKKIIINYATYDINVQNHEIIEPPFGMWHLKRYVNLIMGEIVRLQDTKDGYGPNGQNFISHVDIPENVINAFHRLQVSLSNSVRHANPKYAN